MRLQSVPAARGSLWVRLAFRTFFRRPIAFALLFAAFMFASVLLALLPVVGLLLSPAIFPVVTIGFMIATRITLEGGFPTMRVFVEPLIGDKSRVRAMWQLCLVCSVAIVAATLLCDALDPSAYQDPMEAIVKSQASQTTPESLSDSIQASGLWSNLLRYGLAAVLLLPFWHASALVYWGGYGCAQALFSTTIAWWRNRGALLVFALTWLALFMGTLVIGGVLLALLGPQVLFAALVPITLLFATMFYVSLYYTFTDSFVMPDPQLAVDAT
jgi:hypothetical protein